MHFDGHNGQIEVLEDRIVISRKGVFGFLLKGDKTIPFASITAVQFKTASAFFNGYFNLPSMGQRKSRPNRFSRYRRKFGDVQSRQAGRGVRTAEGHSRGQNMPKADTRATYRQLTRWKNSLPSGTAGS